MHKHKEEDRMRLSGIGVARYDYEIAFFESEIIIDLRSSEFRALLDLSLPGLFEIGHNIAASGD